MTAVTGSRPVVSGFPTPNTAGAAFIKVDENGGLVWSNLDADGQLMLLLHARMLLDGANNAYLAAGTLFEMAVCKVNSDGTSAWTQTVAGSGHADAIVLGDNDNSVFVVGGVTARISQGGGGGIPCEDLLSFQVRCKSGGGGQKLQAKLTLTDTSHSGEQVTITVDGDPTPVTINGNKATLSINNPAPGEHTVELTDPAGCFPPMVPSCD